MQLGVLYTYINERLATAPMRPLWITLRNLATIVNFLFVFAQYSFWGLLIWHLKITLKECIQGSIQTHLFLILHSKHIYHGCLLLTGDAAEILLEDFSTFGWSSIYSAIALYSNDKTTPLSPKLHLPFPWFLGTRVCPPKWYLDRFSRFLGDHRPTQKHRQTNRPHLMLYMQCGKIIEHYEN